MLGRIRYSWVRPLPVLLLSACSSVEVNRVVDGDDQEGLRYCLPQPFLVVTPQPDGKVDVKIEMHADRSQQYAINASSFLAMHRLETKLSKGLLSSVKWNGRSDAVAAEAVKAAGAIAEKELEVEKARQDAARERAEEQADKIEALQAKLEEAKLELALAQEELKSASTEAEKTAAELKVRQAKARVRHYEQQLRLAQQNSSGGGSALRNPQSQEGTQNQQESDEKEDSIPEGFNRRNRWGPVYFRIVVDKANCLSLVPVKIGAPNPQVNRPYQMRFESYTAPRAATAPNPGPQSPQEKLVLTPAEFTVDTTESAVSFTIMSNQDLHSIEVVSFESSTSGEPAVDDHIPSVKRVNSKSFQLMFKRSTPPMEYKLLLHASKAQGAEPEKRTVTVTVQ